MITHLKALPPAGRHLQPVERRLATSPKFTVPTIVIESVGKRSIRQRRRR